MDTTDIDKPDRVNGVPVLPRRKYPARWEELPGNDEEELPDPGDDTEDERDGDSLEPDRLHRSVHTPETATRLRATQPPSASGVDLRPRLLISVLFTIPVLLLSPNMVTGMGTMGRMEWISAVAVTAITFYGGWPFFKGAAAEVRLHRPRIMTAIGAVLTFLYIYSLSAFAANGMAVSVKDKMCYFCELAILVNILLLIFIVVGARRGTDARQ